MSSSETVLDNQLRITLSWKNTSNFDKVQRIRYIHKAQETPGSETLFTIKDQTITRAKNGNYFLTNRTNEIYTDLDRLNATYGEGREHSFYFYFSPHTTKDLWFDLNSGDILYITMTDELLNTDFSEYSGEIFVVKPSLRKNQFVGTVAGNKYLFEIRRQNVNIFGNFRISFLTTQKPNNSFKITTEMAAAGTTSYLVRDEYSSVVGALTWEGGSANAVEFILSEMNVTDDQGVNRKLSMLTTGEELNDINTYILSYSGGNTAPKLVHYDDVSNFDDIDLQVNGEYSLSVDGRCGPDHNRSYCPPGQCCSQWGYCGGNKPQHGVYCSKYIWGPSGPLGFQGAWNGEYDHKII